MNFMNGIKSNKPIFVATFDDRFLIPKYIKYFIANTLQFCDLNFITPKKNINFKKTVNLKSKFKLRTINPNDQNGYKHVKYLFNELFVNYSTNNSIFEKSCFERWFALNAATNELKKDDIICLLDTDFLIGMKPIDLFNECISKKENDEIHLIANWNNKYLDTLSPEITFMTKSYLYGFCEYLITIYFSPAMKSKLLAEYFHTIGNGSRGGICDMRALGSYAKLHKNKIFNLNNLKNFKIIFNLNHFVDEEAHEFPNWKISFNQYRQILSSRDNSIKIIGTHFQGKAKDLINLACIGKRELNQYLVEKNFNKRKIALRKYIKKINFLINTIIKILFK